eukprot:TRINITY_DN688_c0_g1_i1.p2 TRINITY_DN688_c0_g1~~TRINITY_DN688_c0_g1_i1.p2  ORF type:complete len:207 (-),score=79.41 TRINITY_DN688_c0_g1_i1:103-672(-)
MPVDRCADCGKIVYITEKLTILNKVFHKTCFKCVVCGKVLNMKNYAAVGGKSYCQPHYPAPGKNVDPSVIPEAGSTYGDASRGATQVITTEVEPVNYAEGKTSRAPVSGGYSAPAGSDSGYASEPTSSGYDNYADDQPAAVDTGYDNYADEQPAAVDSGYDNAGYDNQTDAGTDASNSGYDPSYDYGNY